jgi:hypothetical protein
MKLVQLFLLTSILLCCTISKRVHLPGYHVEWKNKSQSNVQGKENKENNYLTQRETQPEKTSSEEEVDVSERSVNEIYSKDSKQKDQLKKEVIKKQISNSFTALKVDLKKKKAKILKPIAPAFLDLSFLRKIGILLIIIGVLFLFSLLVTKGNGNFANSSTGKGCFDNFAAMIFMLILSGIAWLLVWIFGFTNSLVISINIILLGVVLVIIPSIIRRIRG